MNATMKAFGYPRTLVHAYERWVVVLRPKQVTLGSLVLACSEPVRAFGDVSPEGFAELGQAVADIERVLGAELAHDKINYLMLMMVDPDVHFHVIPRYAAPREHAGTTFEDTGWPGPPDLGSGPELAEGAESALLERFRAAWGRR